MSDSTFAPNANPFAAAPANAPAAKSGGNRREDGKGIYANIDLEVAPGKVISFPYGADLNERIAKSADQKKLLELLLSKLDALPAGEQEITLNCPITIRVRPNKDAAKEVEVQATDWAL